MTFTALRRNAGSIVMPKPGPDGTRTMPFSHLSDEVSLLTGMSASPLNSVNGTGLGMHEAKMRRVEIAQARARHVRRAKQTGRVGHPGNPHRADEAAVVVQVGLDDVDAPVGDHPAEAVLAELLLAAGDRDAKRIGDRLRVLEVVEPARLFVEAVVVLLHQPADLDRFGHVVGAVRVGVEGHLLAERLADQRDELLGPARQASRRSCSSGRRDET